MFSSCDAERGGRKVSYPSVKNYILRFKNYILV